MPCIDTSVTAVISHQETLKSHQHLTQIPKTCPNNTSPDSMLCSSAVHSIFAKSYCNLKLNQANSLFIFIFLASSTLQAPRPLRVSHHLDRQVTSYDQSWTIEPRGLWKKRKTNKQKNNTCLLVCGGVVVGKILSLRTEKAYHQLTPYLEALSCPCVSCLGTFVIVASS